MLSNVFVTLMCYAFATVERFFFVIWTSWMACAFLFFGVNREFWAMGTLVFTEETNIHLGGYML